MPPRTLAYVEGFRDGINAVALGAPPPPEFAVLGIRPQAWTVADLFAVSRLCSADYTWRIWRALATLRRERGEKAWAALWSEFAGFAAVAQEDGPLGPQSPAGAVATAFAPNGSNAYAAAGSRTRSGKPLLAADPHLIIAAPSPWLVAGLAIPGLSVWGIMLPALPIFGMGRNDHGAWGGTNSHATSSALVDVAGEPVSERQVTIPVRGRRPATRTLRDSPFGPVVSGTALFALPHQAVALHWMGHRPSDEYTPFLKLMHAADHEAFADAVDGIGLPGLNMVWAGADGDIGKMIACHVPARPHAPSADMVIGAADVRAQWQTILTAKHLPREHNPAAGFVASANDEPDGSPVSIGLFFSDPHRVERLRHLLGTRTDLTRADMVAFQGDTHLGPAAALAAHLAGIGGTVRPQSPVLAALAVWDGRYDGESGGALAFELVAAALIDALEAEDAGPSLSQHWRPFVRLTRLVEGAAPDRLAEALALALDNAQGPHARHRTWGGLHKVRLSHPLTRLPWLSARLPTIEFASGGTNETLMKSAHPFTAKEHASTFGANARFIADLSDPDETYSVLLGGQDGWPGSSTMFDMVGAWRRGDYLRLPRRASVLAREFPHVTAIAPGHA